MKTEQKMIAYTAYINKQFRCIHGSSKPVLSKAAFDRVESLQMTMKNVIQWSGHIRLVPMYKELYEKLAPAYNRSLINARKRYPYIENFHKWFHPAPEKFEESQYYLTYVKGREVKL